MECVGNRLGEQGEENGSHSPGQWDIWKEIRIESVRALGCHEKT